jgi:hypothetical protein
MQTLQNWSNRKRTIFLTFKVVCFRFQILVRFHYLCRVVHVIVNSYDYVQTDRQLDILDFNRMLFNICSI